MKLIRLIKMCLSDTYSENAFRIKNGFKQVEGLSSLHLYFAS
jgi:hypothetical protein